MCGGRRHMGKQGELEEYNEVSGRVWERIQ